MGVGEASPKAGQSGIPRCKALKNYRLDYAVFAVLAEWGINDVYLPRPLSIQEGTLSQTALVLLVLSLLLPRFCKGN